MPVYLPTAVVGNDKTLLTLGHSAEIMGWFYPNKDHAQNIHQCIPCVYIGAPHHGSLHWTYGQEWQRHQHYENQTNICVTEVMSQQFGLYLKFTDVVPTQGATLLRRIEVENTGDQWRELGLFHYGDWNLGGIRMGNAVRYDHEKKALVQVHRDVALAVGGDALQTWQCGKAGTQWGSNALNDLGDGALCQSNLEIGDVNWSFGFNLNLAPGEKVERTAIFALGGHENEALASLAAFQEKPFDEYSKVQRETDTKWLSPGLRALEEAEKAGGKVPENLRSAYLRSLSCLPLLCGEEGVALAAPEFDPEFISCGGYGYLWPRDGGEYVSGLIDAGYPEFAEKFFDWSAKHQDESGLWHQRYFLNGQPGPNWCLPPDMLQIDQVGAVLWAYGKARRLGGLKEDAESHRVMIRKAADYLLSRLTERGVHGNAFDTWETFIGSFTYSNAAIYAAFVTASEVLGDEKYAIAAKRVKEGVLQHFVRKNEYSYLVRGFNSDGYEDSTVDSASLGAIEPFGLLDLTDARDLEIAEGTLRAITERLDVEWEGGRAIRRFEGDGYVGGVPACVNTLWMARCCLAVAEQLGKLGRVDDAQQLTERASVYLSTVLHRATPTGLLPELMNGPEWQRYWAAPHGWAMASFVSGVLMLARRLGK